MNGDESITIRVSEALKAFVDEQVAAGGHVDAAEYIRALLSAEFNRTLDAKLVEALESGTTELTREEWDRIRREVSQRIAQRRPA